jgi:hypothetical protein
MRIRMGLFGWMVLGPFILAVAVIFCMAKLTVVLFLAMAKAIDTHNRRRGVRKAYERRRALQSEAYRRGVSTETLSAKWHPPTPISRRIPVDCTPQWQTSAPRDDPNWRPRAR